MRLLLAFVLLPVVALAAIAVTAPIALAFYGVAAIGMVRR